MVRLCFDYGHGGRDCGALYKGRKESLDNLAIGRNVAELIRNLGIEVGETRTSDISMGLKERVNFANKGKYDYFISFHRNAFQPEKANGVETFIYTNASIKSNRLAIEVQKTLIEFGFRNRGVKMANFYVLRETKMPAILIELGFIDNSKDNYLFDLNRRDIAQELAKTIILEVNK